MDKFKAWLFGTPEGTTAKIIVTGLLGVALSQLTTGDINPLIVLAAPAIITPIINYLSKDYKQYGKGSDNG